MTMMLLILGIGAFLLPILLHLAIRLRLGVPLLYAVLALTVFHGCIRPIRPLVMRSSSYWSVWRFCPG